jgi:tetratricopeptide (TPR) repeat protein
VDDRDDDRVGTRSGLRRAHLWREGEYWSVMCGDATIRLRDTKGLRYLAVLATHPEAEFHAVDLVAAGDRARAVAVRSEADGPDDLEAAAGLGDAGEVLDAPAKAAYRERLEALRGELEEAESFNDPERAANAREEIEFVARELSAAVGLGGRDRRAASSGERARVNVTRSIRAVLKRIADEEPVLGRLLDDSVRTGTYCAFCPAPDFELVVGEEPLASEEQEVPSTPARPVAAPAPPAPPPSDVPGDDRIVGRERELEQLERAMLDAEAGRGSLYLIAGEPGVGKTRLADAASLRAQELGARSLWGRCWEGGGAPAFWPWIQVLRSYVRDEGAEAAAREIGPQAGLLADLVPELRVEGDASATVDLDSEQARFAFFDSVATALVTIAAARPMVLVLDDLHAADEPSLRLLEFLARSVRDSRVLVLGTYRHGEGGAAAAELLGRLAPQSRLMTLSGLDQTAVAAFLGRQTGSSVTAESVRALHEITEGNPFFMEELMRLLVARGMQELPEQLEAETMPLPAGVQEAIRSRLDPLPEDGLRVLEIAALLGKEFGLPPLERIAGIPRERLLDLLDESMRRALVEEVRGVLGRYRFSHALVREVIHENLTASARIALHRRIGEGLEELYGEDLELHLAELAHHFAEAAPLGDIDKAASYAVRAGDRAMRLLAFEEAARQFELAIQALDLKPHPDPATRCDALLALGAARARAGDRPGSQDAFREAADVAQRMGDTDREARAGLGFAGRHWTTGFADQAVIDVLERVIAALGDGDGILKARAVGRLATELYYAPGESARADALSAEGVRIARTAGDPAAVASALDARLAAVWRPANLDERLELAGEIVTLAEQAGASESELRGRGFRATCLLEACDVAGAEREIETGMRIAEELRQPLFRWHMLGLRTLRALETGRFDEGAKLADEAYRVGRLADEQTARHYLGAQMAILSYCTGEWEDLEQPLTEFVERYPLLTSWRCTLAFLYANTGRASEALRELRRAGGEDWADVAQDSTWLLGVCRAGESAALAGDPSYASVFYRLLVPYSARNVVLGRVASISIGPVARFLAIIAAAMEEYDTAVAHGEDALATTERMEARPWHAHTQYDVAQALLGRGAPGDEERAGELLDSSARTAESLGMRRLIERAAG